MAQEVEMLKCLSVGVALVVVLGCGSRNGATTSLEASQDAVPASAAPAVHELTIGAGTVLPLTLETTVQSNVNHVEDRVQARLRQPIVIDGTAIVPRGSRVEGVVTDAQRSGKVKGRARLTIRFNTLVVNDRRYDIATNSLTRVAPGTKAKDAEKIGIPAAGGAVIGGLVGGKKGAGVGALIGGGAGTGVVLSTSGKEVRLGSGAQVSVRLARPITIRVPVSQRRDS
jgi:hypothetical protein